MQSNDAAISPLAQVGTPGATEVLASFALSSHEPANEHREALARALLDTVGVALAGHDSAAVQILDRWSRGERASGSATIWTSGERTTPAQAALVNGTAGHALDWDDVAPNMVLHPSTVLLPALVAVAEQTGASGRQLLEAHEVGAAVFRAVTEVLPGPLHYERGWHSTATVGRIATTAALCKLRGLSETQSRHALGLAGSLAAGSLANFGSMTKPLHAGVSAHDAVMATALAGEGFTANAYELESRDGFFSVYGDAGQGDLAVFGARLEHWRTRWTTEWAIKRFPSCYATHRAAEASLELFDRLSGQRPERVTVTVASGLMRPLLDREPRDGGEAKFSMPYVVSTALTTGRLRISDFSKEAFAGSRDGNLMGRIAVREAAVPPAGPLEYDGGYAVVQVELPSGEELVARVERTKGDGGRPLSDAELLEKFEDCCAARGFDETRTVALASTLRGLPDALNFWGLSGVFA